MSVVVVATLVGVVGRENRRWVDRCMNIHDLTISPYTATGLCLHYCISNSVDGSQNSVFVAARPASRRLTLKRPRGPLRITAGSRHYAGSLHIIHSDWDSIKFG